MRGRRRLVAILGAFALALGVTTVQRQATVKAGVPVEVLPRGQAVATNEAATLSAQARAALAQTSGESILAGLRQPVEVIRDRWGVPHIYARTVHDLFFAQGFVAAQDRLWQLDLWRRIEEGKLSEVLGPAGIRRDTFARLLRYRGNWGEEWRSYGQNAREIAAAFVAGINAQIDLAMAQPGNLPLEFQLTGSRPGHWAPEVVVGRMAGYVMTRNARSEVQRARLVRRVGVEKAAALMPTTPRSALVVPDGLDLDDITDNILDLATGTSESVDFAPLRSTAPSLESLLTRPAVSRVQAKAERPDVASNWQAGGAMDAAMIGSNDWVVSGKLTATGKPLLANDPHRALMLPSLRYTVHLNGPGWNVIGAGEPALPGIAAGHNDRVAFGFTIVGMDQQDLYVEQLDPADNDRYLYNGAWETMRVERERIKVKGEADREVELRFTRHGPVLHVDAARHRAYALRWVGSEPGSAGYLRSLALNTARSLQDFRAAVSGWKVPSENIVYADVDGNIAWIAAGLAPIRPNWNGLLPVPGTGRYEWAGFLKADALPQLANPASGFIATANHDILPPGYREALGYEFGAPWRFARIVEVLTLGKKLLSGPGFTVGHFERLQHDETSIPARAIAGALKRAMAERKTPAGDADAANAATLLGNWNGLLSKSSPEAALYETWSPLLASAFTQSFVTSADREAAGARMPADQMLALLARAGLWTPEPGITCWVDGTPRPNRSSIASVPPTPGALAQAESGLRDNVIEVLTGPSLGDAWRQTVKRLGPDPRKWAWGDVHHASFEHPLAFTPDRRALMNLPAVRRGGDGTTPNATGAGARQTAGASYREVIDLSDWDASVTINVPGESGQPGSDYYSNLLPLWAEGQYHQMAFSRAAVERVAAKKLRLLPAAKRTK